LNWKEAQAIPWIALHFKRLDEDRDGKVTVAELCRMQR
jgi:Ca2+-binding EF-hand superfamily protein